MTFPLNFVALLASLMWPFTLCYFSTFTTNRLASLSFSAYDSNWPEYPIELRKHIILLVKRSQKPANFYGFNLIHSTMETFAQVNRALIVYSNELELSKWFFSFIYSNFGVFLEEEFIAYFVLYSSANHHARIIWSSGAFLSVSQLCESWYLHIWGWTWIPKNVWARRLLSFEVETRRSMAHPGKTSTPRHFITTVKFTSTNLNVFTRIIAGNRFLHPTRATLIRWSDKVPFKAIQNVIWHIRH